MLSYFYRVTDPMGAHCYGMVDNAPDWRRVFELLERIGDPEDAVLCAVDDPNGWQSPPWVRFPDEWERADNLIARGAPQRPEPAHQAKKCGGGCCVCSGM